MVNWKVGNDFVGKSLFVANPFQQLKRKGRDFLSLDIVKREQWLHVQLTRQAMG